MTTRRFPPDPGDPATPELLEHVTDLAYARGLEHHPAEFSRILGRPVRRGEELTAAEATALIDAITAMTREDGTLLCSHLVSLERELIDAGVERSYQYRPHERNARNWAYFECILDRDALRSRLPDVVEDTEQWGTHAGQWGGFWCSADHDAVVGHHPDVNTRVGWNKPLFP